MKLVCIKGPFEGKQYPIKASGISIGREEDNDIVLKDLQSSRYHARIQCMDDVWYVTDLESSNGVYVNHRKIVNSAPLSLGDEIKIGDTVYHICDDQETWPPPPEPKKVGRTTTIFPLGSKRSKFYVGLSVFLVVCAVIIIIAKTVQPSAPEIVSGDPPPETFGLAYSKLMVDEGNCFQFRLAVEGDQLTYSIADAVNNRFQEEALSLPPEIATDIRQRSTSKAILALESPTPGNVSGKTRMQERLVIRQRGSGVIVDVQDTTVPVAMSDLIRDLGELVRPVVALTPRPVPEEEALEEARAAFKEAELAFHDALVDPTKYVEAVKGYQQTLDWLKPLAEHPDIYAVAESQLEVAKGKLAAAISELRQNAKVMTRARQYEQAIGQYQIIRKYQPDPSSEVHRDAVRNIATLEGLLRQRR